jgi:hypothetical protein
MLRSRQRTFRTSVVTVLAAFAAGACVQSEPASGDGSELDEHPPADGRERDSGKDRTDAGLSEARPGEAGLGAREAGSGACPPQEPVAGAACESWLSCLYGPQDSCVNPARQYRCIKNRVDRFTGSCNPPRPDWVDASRDAEAGDASMGSDAGTCPAYDPDAGSVEGMACEGELSCVYERCVRGGDHPTIEARCVDGRFRVLRASCNPPPFLYDASAVADAALDAARQLADAGGGLP